MHPRNRLGEQLALFPNSTCNKFWDRSHCRTKSAKLRSSRPQNKHSILGVYCCEETNKHGRSHKGKHFTEAVFSGAALVPWPYWQRNDARGRQVIRFGKIPEKSSRRELILRKNFPTLRMGNIQWRALGLCATLVALKTEVENEKINYLIKTGTLLIISTISLENSYFILKTVVFLCQI